MLSPYIEATICELKAQQEEHPGQKLHLDSPKRVGKTLYYEVEPDGDIPSLYEGAVVPAKWRTETFRVDLNLISETRTVVILDRPLPDDCKRLTITIDLTFILEKLIEYLHEVDRNPGGLTTCLCQKNVGGLGAEQVNPCEVEGLNQYQNAAVARMLGSQFHLLWGPPGTGKTKTLGSLAARIIGEGRSCLLLSISNSAVDELTKATISAWCGEELEEAVGVILRYGSTASPRLRALASLYLHPEGEGVSETELEQLKEKRETLVKRHIDFLTKGIAPDAPAMKQLASQIHTIATKINNLGTQKKSLEEFLPRVQCVATTLARCVTDKNIRLRSYDAVIVDECSMVPLPYAFVAASIAQKQVIFGGDPKQLPPISVSATRKVRDDYGRNVFQFLGVDRPTRSTSICSFLNAQYRMTPRIREIVSTLVYSGALIDGRKTAAMGRKPLFVDVSGEYCRTYYSVSQKSYFNPLIIPILRALSESGEVDLDGGSLLTLSPFRPQQAIMRSALIDFFPQAKSPRPRSSTIHGAQGGQAHTVIVDLTSHGTGRLPRFFRDEICSHLLNVAFSRAQRRLVVLSTGSFLKQCAVSHPFFRQLECMVSNGDFRIEGLDDLFGYLPKTDRREWLRSLGSMEEQSDTILLEWGDDPYDRDELQMIQALPGANKCIVRKRTTGTNLFLRGITSRDDVEDKLPSMGFGNGCLLLRHRNQYISIVAPKSGLRTVSIAIAHLFEGFVDLQTANRIRCEMCELMMTPQCQMGTTLLRCPNGHHRHCSEKDMNVLAALYKVACPECEAIMVGRTGKSGVFLGCSNYPTCNGTRRASYLVDGAFAGTNKD